ncbi:helix-turn-helix transcriptional regulator (plasmid) [Streptomyces sp. S1A1-7]|uniref:winged helix-turn-helix transcriptional regulator n=1 Tax=Streptomyces sp. S1A1-7 TaxID=2594459 RepID=UPI0011648F51|nr:helix-turn-helix domain-containing protein [Streptomyces sp. S1A1-7]QDN74466.1 helix-turn-helix transcriptional regulator [Streptomyces sp. S1A1-7]
MNGRDDSSERLEIGGSRQVDAVTTRVFDLLGKRWSGPLIAVLLAGPAHFTELHRAVPGISERMLSERLAHLAAAGLVLREVREGPPLRVQYRLTQAGVAIRPALEELRDWALAHLGNPAGGDPC